MSPLRKQGSRAKNWIPASAGMTNAVSATVSNYLKPRMLARILAENIVDGKFNIDVYQKTRVCLQIKNLHIFATGLDSTMIMARLIQGLTNSYEFLWRTVDCFV